MTPEPGQGTTTSAFARPSSLAAVSRLLTEAGLPSSDLTAAHLEHFLACGPSDAPDGIVGVELCGSVALLRSLAVGAEHRGRGCGRALVAQVERYARSRGAKDIYLLTTGAERFFEQLGYARVEREAVPAAIRHTREFAALCPSGSTAMLKRLEQSRLVDWAALMRLARASLVGLAAGAAVGAFAGWIAALYVPEEFSRAGLVELVAILAVAGAVAGLIQRWRR
jgi:amino-acid N-acetyltransferase